MCGCVCVLVHMCNLQLSRAGRAVYKQQKITHIFWAHGCIVYMTEGGVASITIYLGADKKCEAVDHMHCNSTSELLVLLVA